MGIDRSSTQLTVMSIIVRLGNTDAGINNSMQQNCSEEQSRKNNGDIYIMDDLEYEGPVEAACYY